MSDVIEHWPEMGLTIVHRIGTETASALARCLERLEAGEHWPPPRGLLLDLRGLLLPAAVATAEYVATYAHLLERPGLLRIALVLALPSQAWLAEALHTVLPANAPFRTFTRFPDATQWLLGREYAGEA